MTIKGITMLLFTTVFQLLSFSQGPPPPADMASEENQKLIDEIVEITKFKEKYLELCTRFIEEAAMEKGWSIAEVEKRKKKIDVDQFIRNNFYNSMASLSSDELKEIIVFLKKLNKKNPNIPFLLTNHLIENNIVNDINHLLK